MTEFTHVPFIQFLRPNRKREYVKIERPPEIIELAGRFIADGGWFECEEVIGHASLTACLILNDEPQDIEIVVVLNGPGIEEAVDRLVIKAVNRLESYKKLGAKIDPNGAPYRATMTTDIPG